MIKAVIIDDEHLLVKSISFMLQKYCPQVRLTGSADSAISGKKLIEDQLPDLVFLDIQMPYGNGFDLLNSIENHSFETIIISAFEDYAIKAFKFEALDYLLKPIDIEELINAVDKATERITKARLLKEAEAKLQDNSSLSIDDQKLRFQTSKGFVIVGFEDILFLESNGNYTYINLVHGEQYLVTKQLGEFERQLPSSIFYRTHNEYIININKVNNYIKGRGGYAVLQDGIQVKISANKKTAFLNRYNK